MRDPSCHIKRVGTFCLFFCQELLLSPQENVCLYEREYEGSHNSQHPSALPAPVCTLEGRGDVTEPTPHARHSQVLLEMRCRKTPFNSPCLNGVRSCPSRATSVVGVPCSPVVSFIIKIISYFRSREKLKNKLFRTFVCVRDSDKTKKTL